MKRYFSMLLVLVFGLFTLMSCSKKEQPVGPVTESEPLSISAFAASGITSGDDPVYGPGSLTIDSKSGLEWLDLTLSTNLSPDFVSTQLGPGGQFEGFRAATIAELQTLFSNAGIPDISFGPGTLTSANYEPVVSLMTLIGSTIETPDVWQTFGYLGEASPFRPQNLAIGMMQAYHLTQVGSADPVQASGPSSNAAETVGHYLVRLISKTPEEQVEDLIDEVTALVGTELNSGQANGLTRSLENALRSLEKGKTAPACSQLQDFIDEVVEKTPPLSAETSAALIAAAQSIRNDLGCK